MTAALHHHHGHRFLSGVVTLLFIASVGCATESGIAARRKDRAKTSGFAHAQALKSDLQAINPLIKRTTENLNALQAAASQNPKPAYRRLSANIEQLQEDAYEIRVTTDVLQRRGHDYYRQWIRQAVTAESGARTLTAEQRTASRESYRQFVEFLDNAKDDFRAFAMNLLDLKDYLSDDLSRENIEAHAPLIDKVMVKAIDAQQRIDVLIGELDRAIAAEKAMK